MTPQQKKLFEAFIKELPMVNGYLLMSKELAYEIYTYFQSYYYMEDIKKKMIEIAGAVDIYLYDK